MVFLSIDIPSAQRLREGVRRFWKKKKKSEIFEQTDRESNEDKLREKRRYKNASEKIG